MNHNFHWVGCCVELRLVCIFIDIVDDMSKIAVF